MSQLQVTGEAKIRDIQGPVVANDGVITALDGAASQYVRGDGTLADFPTSSGGGSSVSYYLNGSVSQGNIGGSVYYEMSKTPVIGTGTDFSISSNNLIAQFITDANDPSLLEVPGGNFNCEFYFSVNNNTGNPNVFAELYKYDGSTFTLLGSSVSIPESINQGTTIAPYYFAIPVGTASLTITDRIAIKIFANVDGRTVTLHTENSHLCQVVTTFSKGITALNNLTDQVQYFGTGTSGSDFNIVSSGSTHTFNIPNAGSGNRGLITSGSQTIAGAKTFGDLLTAANLNVSGVLTVFGNLANGTFSYTLPSANGQLALTSQIPSITGTAYQVTRYNVTGTGLEGGSITDNGTLTGSPSGLVTINSRLTVNNYTEINRYLSIIQNVDSAWALPSTGTSLEAFITSSGGGLLVSDTGYLRPRKASDDTFKRFIIQGDDLILNDAVRRTLINKAGPTQSTTKLEVAGYTRFDASVNINSVLQFNATDAATPTYLQAPSGNVTLMTTGQIILGTNSSSKFIFDVNGALNLGTSDNSNIININNQFSTLNGTMQGVHITPSIVSATPVIYTGVRSYPQFFLSTDGNYAQVTHFAALNASNTRDTATQVGLYIENLSSTGLAYGIQSTLSSGTSRYNLYIDGTAINYLKGRLGVDQNNPQYAVDVTGDVNVTGNFKVNGTNLTQGISGSGTQHYIPKFTSATSVGNSSIYQAPASGHLLVNTTFDYSASGGYLQVAGGFTTESFANIIYGSALFAGNSVYLKLVNGNTIQGIGDRTYFIENRVNAGATSANYYLNYWDGGTTYTRYSLDNTGLHAFSGDMTLSGSLLSPLNVITNDNNFAFNIELKNTNNGTQALTGVGISNSSGTRKGQILWIPSNYITTSLQNSFLVSSVTNIPLVLCADATGANTPNIKFQSGASDRMTLFGNTGNLAIGFSTDNGSKLQVAGGATFSSSVTAGDLISTSYGSARIQVISTTNSANSGLRYGAKDSAGTAKNAGIYYVAGTTTATTFLSLAADDNNYLFNVLANGNVGIGTSTFPTSSNRLLFLNAPSGAAAQFLLGENGTSYAYLAAYGGSAELFTTAAIPLIFGTNSTERMRITSGGNVGIGTSSPVTNLDIQAAISGAYTSSSSQAPLRVYNITNAGGINSSVISFQCSTDGAASNPVARIGVVGESAGSNNGAMVMMTRDGGGVTERMRITSGGDLLVGKTSAAIGGLGFWVKQPEGVVFSTLANSDNTYHVYDNTNSAFRFYVSGSGQIYATSTTIASLSDQRLKENIQDLDTGLDAIMALRPRKYDWKPESGNTAKNVRGFIAQEVETIFPDLIDEWKANPYDENQTVYKSLRQDFIPILVKGMQELKLEKDIEIAELKAQIEELKALIAAK